MGFKYIKKDQTQKNRVNFIFVLLGFIIFISIFLYFMYKSKYPKISYFPREYTMIDQSDDQKYIWNLLKTTYNYDSTDTRFFNNNIGLVKSDKSDFMVRLDGCKNEIKFNNEDGYIDFVNQMKQELINLGYQESKSNNRIDDILFVNNNETDLIYYKNNQVFLIKKNTDQACPGSSDWYRSCPAGLYYINNIGQQLSDATNVLNKLIKDNTGIFRFNKNKIYFNSGANIGKYKILRFNTFDEEDYIILTKKYFNKLKQIRLNTRTYKNFPKNKIDILQKNFVPKFINCMFEGFELDNHCRASII